MNNQLHKVQIAILNALRHAESARFSTLMHATDLQSDTFKFHVRKLVTYGYIEKSGSGDYRLTSAGKEFANNKSLLTAQRQPKLSIALIVPKPDEPDMYLFQQRRRQPFFGFWSCIGGPILWGDEAEFRRNYPANRFA